jgi:hypothetical protein
MTSSVRTRRLGLLCALYLSVPSSAIAAAATPPPALAESLSGPAKEAYVSARILLNNGDFAGAMKKFGQAYDLSEDPRLLSNMAVCARSLRQYAKMQSLLTRYAAEASATMAPGDRADVDGALAAIRNLVGSVRLAVTVAGAQVAVDGEVVQTTPLARPIVVDLGTHVLTVTKDGFQPAQQTVDVQGGTEVAVAIMLVPVRHVAQLSIASDKDATVIVDDTAPVSGRFDGELAPGTHDVRVTEPGRIAYRAQVDLKDGEKRTLQVTLEREKHGATVWPWVAGGAALVAGAVVGGYFLFKSSPETPAPVSGSFATVNLTALGSR